MRPASQFPRITLMNLRWIGPILAFILALFVGLPVRIGRPETIAAAMGSALLLWGAILALQTLYQRRTGRTRLILFVTLQILGALAGCLLGWMGASLHFYTLPRIHLKQLEYGSGMKNLESAVIQFAQEEKRLPRDLDEMVKSGALPPEGPEYSCPLIGGPRDLPYKRCEYELSFASSIVRISVPRSFYTDERYLFAPEHLLARSVGMSDLAQAPATSVQDSHQDAIKRLVPDAFDSPECPERADINRRLISALKADDPLVRWGAAERLPHNLTDCGQARENFEALLGALDDPDPRVRAAIGDSLETWLWHVVGNASAVGDDLRRIFPAMTSALEDPDPRVRASAAFFLGGAGWKRRVSIEPVPAVLENLSAANILPALEKATRDPDAAVRASAASALGRWEADALGSIPTLLQALSDPEAIVRTKAAEGLGEIGPPAGAAAPALINALTDTHESVRWAAADALKALGGTKELEAVRGYRRIRALELDRNTRLHPAGQAERERLRRELQRQVQGRVLE